MAIAFAVLGSGSSGNCTVISLGTDPWKDARNDPTASHGRRRHLLIDCGLSPRTTEKRLAPLGIALADLDGIVVTHFDRDHYHLGWSSASGKLDLHVHAHFRHRSAALRAEVSGHVLRLFQDEVEIDLSDDGCVRSVLLAHDQLGTVGYVVECAGARLGFATDLGRVPDHLYACFDDLDALALESNYDRTMQDGSDRPVFLKRRIMGGAGHLSNDEALRAILRIAERSPLQHIALLHLSRQCNCPRLVQRLYAQRAPHLLDRLTLTNQYTPTPWLHVTSRSRTHHIDLGASTAWSRAGEQLVLF